MIIFIIIYNYAGENKKIIIIHICIILINLIKIFFFIIIFQAYYP
jgi:hypothetical protein